MILNIDDILADASVGGYSANVAISNTTALTLLSVLSALYAYRRYWTNDIDDLDGADIDTIDELLSLANYELTNPIEVDTMVIGSTVLWWTHTAPANYLICDGTQYAKATYPELASTLGITFEADANNFFVPDLRDRVPVGKSGTKAINASGGDEEITLSVANLPSHQHNYFNGNIVYIVSKVFNPSSIARLQGNSTPAGAYLFESTATNHVGDNVPHSNMQPWRGATYIIKAQ